MPKPRGMPSTDDLFEIFPDLPGVRLRTADEQLAQVQRQVQATRERASGKAEKEAGRGTSHAAKVTGQVTKDAAKETAKGTKRAAKTAKRKLTPDTTSARCNDGTVQSGKTKTTACAGHGGVKG